MTLPAVVLDGQGGHLTHHDELHVQINALEAALVASGNLPIATAAGILGDLAPGSLGQVLTADPSVTGKAKWAPAPAVELQAPGGGADATSAIVAALAAADVVKLTSATYPTSTGFLVGAGKNLVSERPDGAIIHYTGTGTGVTLRGRMARMSNIKVRTSNAAATVKAVVIDAPSTDTLFWRLDSCTISGDTRTTGQVGLYFDNTASTAIFWGRAIGCLIENYGKAVDFGGNDPTLGCNANVFTSLQIHNADTMVDLANTYANVFEAFSGDLFTLGINANSGAIRNRVSGRMEGGTGSKGYTLAAGSQENVLTLDDNTVIASTDAGLQNLTTITGIGQPKAWDVPTSDLASFPCYLADGAGTIPTAANSGQFLRIPGIRRAMNLTGAKIVVVTQSGNVAVGLYEFDGATFTRRATTGSVACAVAGTQILPFAAGYITDPRQRYYLLLTADNITATFLSKAIYNQASLDDVGPNKPGRSFYATTAGAMFPPPSSVALTALTPSGGTTDSKALYVVAT